MSSTFFFPRARCGAVALDEPGQRRGLNFPPRVSSGARMLRTFALILAAAPFTWTDADGTIQYTDDVTRVPKRLRHDALPFPLEGFTEAQWASDIPACKDALATVKAAQLAVRTAELELIARREKYEPCKAFYDTCTAPTLTRAKWEKDCQRVPTECTVNVEGQFEYVELQRERFDELAEWLEEMAKWGCARPAS